MKVEQSIAPQCCRYRVRGRKCIVRYCIVGLRAFRRVEIVRPRRTCSSFGGVPVFHFISKRTQSRRLVFKSGCRAVCDSCIGFNPVFNRKVRYC